MQAQLNQKANQSDFDSLREALLLKADKKQTQKDIDRLDALIEQLKQAITGFEDNHRKLKNEVERINQLVEMLQKSMGNLRQQPTPQPVQNNGVGEEVIREVMVRIENLENELGNFRNDYSRWIKDF